MDYQELRQKFYGKIANIVSNYSGISVDSINENTILKNRALNSVLEEIVYPIQNIPVLSKQKELRWKQGVKVSKVLDYIIDNEKEFYSLTKKKN